MVVVVGRHGERRRLWSLLLLEGRVDVGVNDVNVAIAFSTSSGSRGGKLLLEDE